MQLSRYFSITLMLHFLFVSVRLGSVRSTVARQNDMEFFVKEEVAKGTVIASGRELGDLDRPSGYTNADKVPVILNHKDKGASSFDLRYIAPNLQLVVMGRIDREEICPLGAVENGAHAHLGTASFYIDDGKIGTQQLRNSRLATKSDIMSHSQDCAIVLRVAAPNQGAQKLYHILVYVQDVNDNPPKWTQPRLTVTYRDGDPAGTKQPLPLAVDLDVGFNALITYRLEEAASKISNPKTYFSSSNSPGAMVSPLEMFELMKDQGTGEVTSSRLFLVSKLEIDRERQPQGWDLDLTAINGDSTEPLNSLISIHVNITDINDNAPQFTQSVYQPQLNNHNIGVVPENIPVGSTLLQLTASDQDTGPNAALTYGFVPGANSKLLQHFFSIDPVGGELRTIRRLEVDRKPGNVLHLSASTPITFEVQVVDGADSAYTLTGTATVRLRVENVDDEAPEIRVHSVNRWKLNDTFEKSSELPPAEVELTIAENKPLGQLIGLVEVSDPDSNGNEMIRCNLVGQNADHFRLTQDEINNNEYRLYSATIFDREMAPRLVVGLECRDFSDHTTSVRLGVNVLDVNDNAPVFSEKIYNFSIFEDDGELQSSFRYSSTVNRSWLTSDGTVFVTAHDEDAGKNQGITYHMTISKSEINELISINSKTGQVFANGPFDREQTAAHTFTVFAVDGGSPALTGSCKVQVNLVDINDNPPVFSHVIEATESVDGGGTGYAFTVKENQLPGTRVGQVQAFDIDEEYSERGGNLDNQFADSLGSEKARKMQVRSRLVYSLSPNKKAEAFWIDPKTGTITTRSVLDREARATYTFQANVRDGPLTSADQLEKQDQRHVASQRKQSVKHRSHLVSTTVVVTVEDENDNDPVFIQPNATNHMILLDPAAIPGQLLFTLLAKDPDEGLNGEVTYAIKGGNTGSLFSIDSRSGLLYLQNPIPRQTIAEATAAAEPLASSSAASATLVTDTGGHRGDITSAVAATRQHRPVHPTYLLALEVCDQGQPSRCTVFPNLQIQVRVLRDGVTDKTMGNLLPQDGNHMYITDLSYGLLSDRGRTNFTRSLWNQSLVEIVVICLSVLFSLLLIIVMVAVCFFKIRGQSRSNQKEQNSAGQGGWHSTPKLSNVEMLDQNAPLVSCGKEPSLNSNFSLPLHGGLHSPPTTYGNYHTDTFALANGTPLVQTVYASSAMSPMSMVNKNMEDCFAGHGTSAIHNMTASFDSDAYQIMDNWGGKTSQDVFITNPPSFHVIPSKGQFSNQHQPLLNVPSVTTVTSQNYDTESTVRHLAPSMNLENHESCALSDNETTATTRWTEMPVSPSSQRASKATLRAYAGFPKASFV